MDADQPIPTLPVLSTARLRLRPVRGEDLDALHRLWTDPEVRRYLWDDEIISRERAATALRAGLDCARERGYGLWAVEPGEHDALIGFCGLRPWEDGPTPELLVGMLPAYWGRGLAVEACRRVVEYAFDQLGLARIVAATDVPNTASVSLLESLGMRFERRGLLNGLDTLFYSLSRPGR